MEIVFIRHGEPDYTEVDSRGFIGLGREFAPLSSIGIEQAENISTSPDLKDCQIIVSSPYTRALQTAAIISKNNGLEIAVETDLHELIFDTTFMVKGADETKALNLDLINHKGEHPKDEPKKWETISQVVKRSKPIMDKYFNLGYKKIAVVCHGGIIRRFTGEWQIDHCHIKSIEYTDDFTCFGWI